MISQTTNDDKKMFEIKIKSTNWKTNQRPRKKSYKNEKFASEVKNNAKKYFPYKLKQ